MTDGLVESSSVRPAMSDLQPTMGLPRDFHSAVTATLRLLHARLGYETWFLIRVEGAQCVVLHSEDTHDRVRPGQMLTWKDLICYQLINGGGPSVAPRLADVPAYMNTPIARQLGINAYVGVPIKRSDGSLFGMMGAIDTQEHSPESVDDLPLVELFASLLGTILEHEMASAEQQRVAERERALAMQDALTGVFNRRGWDLLGVAEEARCQRYGHSACVLSIDLNRLKEVNDTQGHAAGDELIRRAAKTLKLAAREVDIVARVGGDEFLALLVECNLEGGQNFVERLRLAFEQQDVSASFGLTLMKPNQSLADAVDHADQAMYQQKYKFRLAGMQGSCP